MELRILLCCVFPLVSADPTVEGALGKISGKIDSILGVEIEAFRGIPYAKPPVKQLRFSLPQPFGAVGELQATTYGSDCPHFPAYQTGPSSDEENCLFLNVFRKRGTTNEDKKAVIAIIHGGAFAVGSSAERSQNAETLAGVGDVIVVSFNYRLGIFGFAEMKGLTPGNLGLRDQRLALQWIKDHIADFGGDPKQVTAMGVSAGSISVAAHIMTIADKKNLFQAAIMDAGVVGVPRTLEDSESSLIKLKTVAAGVGCKADSHKMLQCLRKVSVHSLLANSSSVAGSAGITHFGPTSDGVFLPHNVEEYLRRNSSGLRKVRTMVGYALDEGSMFVEFAGGKFNFSAIKSRDQVVDLCVNISRMNGYSLNGSTDEIREKIGRFYVDDNSDHAFNAVSSLLADGTFKCPINTFIQAYSKHNDKVFAYQFERTLNTTHFFVLDPEILGAFHSSPYMHFSGALMLDEGTENEADKQFSLDAMKMISKFSKSDEAVVFRGVEWPSYSKSGKIFIFNEVPTVSKGLERASQCRDLFLHEP